MLYFDFMSVIVLLELLHCGIVQDRVLTLTAVISVHQSNSWPMSMATG